VQSETFCGFRIHIFGLRVLSLALMVRALKYQFVNVILQHTSSSEHNATVQMLVHGQVTIIFVVSVGLSVCLSVCLSVYAVFLSRF